MSKVKPIIGTCVMMCPESEIKWREESRLLHPFEIIGKLPPRITEEDKQYKPNADPRKVIKEFTRSGVGQKAQLPEELRTLNALLKVVEYLMNRISIRTDVNWAIVYDFIFDRLRSVRQDIAIQCFTGPDTMTIFEQAIRFHIYSAYRLGDEITQHYDPHINNVHLRECLQSLLKRYDDYEYLNRPCRPLFEAIYIIYNLGSDEGLNRYSKLNEKYKKHHLIKTAYDMSIEYLIGNYYSVIRKFFNLKPLILTIAASAHISKVHFIAIQRMSFAYHSQNNKFPIETLSQWLCPFETNQSCAMTYVKRLCQYYGLKIDEEFVIFNKSQFKENVTTFSFQKWNYIEIQIQDISISSLITGRRENKIIEGL